MPNRKTHQTVGAISGGIAAIVRSESQPLEHRIVETLAGVLAGIGGGRLPDILDPPTWPGHRSIGHGMVPSGGGLALVFSKPDELQGAIRSHAEQEAAMRESADTLLAQLWHGFLELMLRLLAGAVVGLPAGYASHLLLDATTPKCLPLIA